MIKPQITLALAIAMVGWVVYLTYQVYTFPTVASMIGDKKLAVVKNDDQLYFIFSEKALKSPITITDSAGKQYYVLSRERLIAIGQQGVTEALDRQRIPKDP